MILPSVNFKLEVALSDKGQYIVVWSRDLGPGSVGTNGVATFDTLAGLRNWLASLADQVKR